MKKQKTAAMDSAADLLAEMLEKPVEIDGLEMTFREAMLRSLYRKSLGGDIGASIELQDLRERSAVTDAPEKLRCLVVPELVDPDDFATRVFEQQRQFRERTKGSSDP